MEYIASCSGGCDSVATLCVAREYGEPLTEVVYCEVMFDQNTSGEVPEHKEFVYNVLRPWVEDNLRVPFTILRSEKTYTDCFNHIICRGDGKGKKHGFAIPGMCLINRDCKIPPIRKYWKAKGGNVTQYVGIEWNEFARLARLEGTNQVSLLAKYGITKQGAIDICHKYGLYSPTYENGKRNGCWFCPNCQDGEWEHLVYDHPELFNKLVALEENAPDRYRRLLTRTETATQIRKRILDYGEQLNIFASE